MKEAAVAVTRVEVWRGPIPSEHTVMSGVMHGLEPRDSNEGTWITVYQGEQILNLLAFRHGETNLLINADLPEGRYTRLRLVCRQARITIGDPEDGTTGRTFVAEPKREMGGGVTLDCEFTVAAGRETSLLLNVDVDEAFLPIPVDGGQSLGEIKGFHFRPASAMRLANLLSAGPANSSGSARD